MESERNYWNQNLSYRGKFSEIWIKGKEVNRVKKAEKWGEIQRKWNLV